MFSTLLLVSIGPAKKGIKVIPCYQNTGVPRVCTQRFRVVGLKGRVPLGDPLINQTKREGIKEILPNGNELIKSGSNIYCLVLDDDRFLSSQLLLT